MLLVSPLRSSRPRITCESRQANSPAVVSAVGVLAHPAATLFRPMEYRVRPKEHRRVPAASDRLCWLNGPGLSRVLVCT